MQDFAARRTMMVDTQVRPNDVTKYPIIEAMLNVKREAFVPDARREAAYISENIEIADGRVLLEARNFSKMLDALNIQSDELVLDIGAGLGYSSAVIARLAEAVVAVEDEALAKLAEAKLAEAGVDNAAVVAGGLAEGAPKHGPYDVIILEGGVEEVPAAVLAQLKEGGRVAAIFMDDALGTVKIGHKMDGNVAWRFAFNATAPLLPGFAKEKSFEF